MGSGRRGILVAVMALILALNNGAFAALAFIGVDAQSNAYAATTPAASLSQSTTKIVPPDTTSYTSTLESQPAFPSPAILLLLALLGQGILLTLVLRRWRDD